MNGPPSDSDWWEDATSDAKAAEGDEQSITSKKHMEENCSDEVEDYDLKLEQPMKGKQFCNRGFLIWSQSREVWVSQGRDTGAEMEKSPPIPSSFRKELVRCLTDRRHFELSQRISLRDMIDAYQDVWNDESCE